MLQRLTSVLGLLSLALLSGSSRTAQADDLGIKIGDGRLHPYASVEGRYDTAAAITTDSNGNLSGVGDAQIRPKLGLKLDVPSQNVAVTLDASAEYVKYLGLGNAKNLTSALSRPQADGDLDIAILRGSQVSFDVGDHVTYSDETTNLASPVGLLSLHNDARLLIPITPGNGNLTITPGYHLGIENYFALFKNAASVYPEPPAELNYIAHRFTLENRWRFLPKTALLLDGEFDYRDQYNNTADSDKYFKVSAGIAGLLTSHLALLARAGYSDDLAARTNSFGGASGISGQVEGSLLPNETTTVRLGVLRTADPANFDTVATTDGLLDGTRFNSVFDTRIYTDGRILLFTRLALHAGVTFDVIQFTGIQYDHAASAADSELAHRTDDDFGANVGADLEVVKWFTVSVGDALVLRTSSYARFPGEQQLSLPDDQVFIRLTFIY